MIEYHKIEGLFAREEQRPHKLIFGQFRNPTVEALKDLDWIFTEKIDGTNIRVHWDGHKVTFGGRTERAQIPATLIEELLNSFGGEINEQVFEESFGDTEVTLYGEGFGASIQSGGAYRKTPGFILFDVFIGGMWLERENVEKIANKFSIQAVPIVLTGSLQDGLGVAKAGFESVVAEEPRPAEGLVGVPVCNVLDRRGKRVVVKLKTKDFSGVSVEQKEE